MNNAGCDIVVNKTRVWVTIIIIVVILLVPLLSISAYIAFHGIGFSEKQKKEDQSSNDYEYSLSEDQIEILKSIARDKANEVDAFFINIINETNILTNFGNDIYNGNLKDFSVFTLPTYEYDENTVDYLPKWGYVHTAQDERNGAWSDWEGEVQTCPYLNSSVVKRASEDPEYAEWLRDEINKTVYFDAIFKEIYDGNQPETELVWMVRFGGLTNSYSVPPIDYGQLLRDKDLTDDWDEDAEDYVTLANARNNPSKSIVWTDPYFDIVGNEWLISCLGPLYLSDEFIGDVGVDMNLGEVERIILKQQIEGIDHSFLIDDKGKVISHPDLKKEMSSLIGEGEYGPEIFIEDLESTNIEFRNVVNIMQDGRDGVNLVVYEDGTRNYIAYAPLSSIDFSIGIVINEDDLDLILTESS